MIIQTPTVQTAVTAYFNLKSTQVLSPTDIALLAASLALIAKYVSQPIRDTNEVFNIYQAFSTVVGPNGQESAIANAAGTSLANFFKSQASGNS